MITSTGWKIIELIYEYIDKVLSDGCIIEDPAKQKAVIYSCNTDKLYDVYYIGIGKGTITKDCSIKVIGHYSLEAILKYITNKKVEVTLSMSGSNWLLSKLPIDIVPDYITPNKPISLYSEIEEENLYKFMLSLN